jgi:hypothetical protein
MDRPLPKGLNAECRSFTSPFVARVSRYSRNTIPRYGNRAATFSELTESRKLDVCRRATGHATPMVTREPMESFDMPRPKDQIDNSRTKPVQMHHDGPMSSDRSQSDVRLEGCASQARRVLPNSLIASRRGSVTLLRLSRPAKRNALDDATIAGVESFFGDPPGERSPSNLGAAYQQRETSQ